MKKNSTFSSGKVRMETKNSIPSWLPNLLLFEDFKNDWGKYEAALYKEFGKTIKSQNFKYQNKTVGYDKKKSSTSREEIFEHLISEEKDKNDPTAGRIPDIRRCERLCWIRPILDNLGSCEISPMIYPQTLRPSDIREIIYIPELEYVIILRKGRNQYFLITAYRVEDPKRRARFEKNYKNFLNRK